jgi:hypothetical protein
MTDEKDERLTQRLQQMAPPARDPLFRVKVLERRERKRFRAQVSTVAVTVLTLLMGSAMSGSAQLIVLGVGLIAGVAIYASAMLQLLRRMTR